MSERIDALHPQAFHFNEVPQRPAGRSNAGTRPVRLFGQITMQALREGMRAARESEIAAQPSGEAAAGDASALFRQQFGAAAADSQQFHALMAQVYGSGYNRQAAEQLRGRALAGDFAWLPSVRYVDAPVLGGANGAYDAAGGQVLINAQLRGTGLAGQTFVEEAGHHIDTLLNASDAAGDEGELLRRTLGGEALGDADRAAIRAEDDHGTIELDGRSVEVEFWSLGRALTHGLDRATHALEHVTEHANSVARDASRAGNRLVDSSLRGAGRSSAALLHGDLRGAARAGRESLHVGRSIVGHQVAGEALRGLAEAADVHDALTGSASERRLTQAEIDYLRGIYGDQLDYDAIRIQRGGSKRLLDAPGVTVGNEIWMAEGNFNADGSLSAGGLNLLAHEACHVWQYAQGGPGYLGDSMYDQVRHGRGGVGTGGAYDWLAAADAGTRFDGMRPEQQAALVEYIDRALRLSPDGALTRENLQAVLGDHKLSDGAFAIALEAQRRVRGG